MPPTFVLLLLLRLLLSQADDTPTSCSAASRYMQSTLPVMELAGIGVHQESDEMWLRPVRRAFPNATLFVDIGFNKGYLSAQIAARWAPNSHLNPKTLYSALRRVAGCPDISTSTSSDFQTHPCYANALDLCGEANPRCTWTERDELIAAADAKASPRDPSLPSPQIIAIDASAFSNNLWASAAEQLSLSNVEVDFIDLHRMALGAVTGGYGECSNGRQLRLY